MNDCILVLLQGAASGEAEQEEPEASYIVQWIWSGARERWERAPHLEPAPLLWVVYLGGEPAPPLPMHPPLVRERGMVFAIDGDGPLKSGTAAGGAGTPLSKTGVHSVYFELPNELASEEGHLQAFSDPETLCGDGGSEACLIFQAGAKAYARGKVNITVTIALVDELCHRAPLRMKYTLPLSQSAARCVFTVSMPKAEDNSLRDTELEGRLQTLAAMDRLGTSAGGRAGAKEMQPMALAAVKGLQPHAEKVLQTLTMLDSKCHPEPLLLSNRLLDD